MPQNQWTYDFFEDVDLIEKHSLLVVVHVALTQDFDGALGTWLSVHTHAHLSECAWNKGKSDTCLAQQSLDRNGRETYLCRGPFQFCSGRAVYPAFCPQNLRHAHRHAQSTGFVQLGWLITTKKVSEVIVKDLNKAAQIHLPSAMIFSLVSYEFKN